MSTEIGQMYKAMNKATKEKHKEWHKINTITINKSGIKHTKASFECYLFRSEHKNADFYPSTGRWRDIKTEGVYTGGAEKFIKWFKG